MRKARGKRKEREKGEKMEREKFQEAVQEAGGGTLSKLCGLIALLKI